MHNLSFPGSLCAECLLEIVAVAVDMGQSERAEI